MLMDAVEAMKKTKKWEAPPGVNMDIDMESLISKVHEERSAGKLPAIHSNSSAADAVASSSTEIRPKSRAKEQSHASRAPDSLPLPQPPAVEKPGLKTQQVMNFQIVVKVA